MKAVLGIDPGVDGGLALRATGWAVVEVMPIKEREHKTKRLKSGDKKVIRELDVEELSAWLALRREDISQAFIERAGTRPGQSTQDCAKQWRIFGAIEGVLAALGIPYMIIEARKWSDEFPHGVKNTDKHERYREIKRARRVLAAQLFPGVDLRETARSTTAHEGMTDALFIAEFGRRQRMKGNA